MATPADQLDQYISLGVSEYLPTLVDNVFTHVPALDEMRKNGQIEIQDGVNIRQPILYGKNSTTSSYANADMLDTTYQQGLAHAQYDWKQVATTVQVTGRDRLINSGGKNARQSLLKAKNEQAEKSTEDYFGTAFYGDGTGNSGKDPGGMKLLASVGSPVTNPGGIDPATETWWANLAPSAIANFGTSQQGGPTAGGYPAMLNLYNSIWKTLVTPDVWFACQDFFESFEKVLVANVRYTPADEGKAGFPTLIFKGKKIIMDPYCPGSYASAPAFCYPVSWKVLKFVCHKDANFKHKPALEPVNQDVTVSKILWAGNWVCGGRRSLGVLRVTAA